MRELRNTDSYKAVAAALRTAKWAVTMTKWRIGFETGGKKLGANTKSSKRWQLVPFPGPGGRESAGIVDLLAIRRDHRTLNGKFKRGDLFEIIMIQIKGGGARRPKAEDVKRLRAVADRYRAKAVLLAEWKKGSQANFYSLGLRDRGILDTKSTWKRIDPGKIFR